MKPNQPKAYMRLILLALVVMGCSSPQHKAQTTKKSEEVLTFYYQLTADQSVEESNVRLTLIPTSKGEFKGKTAVARRTITLEGTPFKTEIQVNHYGVKDDYHVYMMLRTATSNKRNGVVKNFRIKRWSDLQNVTLTDRPITRHGKTFQAELTLSPAKKFGEKPMQCSLTEEKINSCLELKTNILSVINQDKDEVGFTKDESKAIATLRDYDPRKLIMLEQACQFDEEVSQCLEIVGATSACDTTFEIYHYFKSLVDGMKQNGWSEKTIALGESAMQKHINYVMRESQALLEIVIAFEIIKKAQDNGFLKKAYKDINPYVKEGQAISNKLKSVWDAKKNRSCTEKMKSIGQERKMTRALAETWVKNNLSN